VNKKSGFFTDRSFSVDGSFVLSFAQTKESTTRTGQVTRMQQHLLYLKIASFIAMTYERSRAFVDTSFLGMTKYAITKTFNPINISSCPVSHLSRPLRPKTTLSMNKINISEIPSIRDSDRIAQLYEKCAILFAQNTDYQWQVVR